MVHRTTRRGPVAALAGVVLVALVAVPASAAGRPEPSSATAGQLVAGPVAAAAEDGIELTGRGYGHGRGLSQHGARGRADAGHTADAIVRHYYPGTTLTTVPDTQRITVWIRRDDDGDTRVVAEKGMTLRGDNPDNGTTSERVVLPDEVVRPDGTRVAPTQWRLRLISLTFHLEGLAGGSWYPHDDPAVTAALSNMRRVTLRTPDGTIRLVTGSSFREYRGDVVANRTTGTVPADVRTTVTLPMGEYLRSVVPAEMPAGWHTQALRAQAIAARTYAAYERDVASRPWWYDTCDTTQCQVFHGVAEYDAAGKLVREYEHTRTDDAIVKVSGRIVTYGGKPAFTQFSASNGGYSVAGSQPYLVAAADPYDKLGDWQAALSAKQLQDKYPGIGVFRDLTVQRDGRGAYGGRVTSVTLRGDRGSVTRTGDQFRSDFALRSTLWTATLVAPSPPPLHTPQRDWDGDRTNDLMAIASSGRMYHYPGRAAATSWGASVQIGHGWAAMGHVTQVYNFSGTRRPEVLATDARTGVLRLYTGTGKGRFGTSRQVGRGWTGFRHVLGVQDWHAKGVPGLMAVDAAGRLYLYPADGRGGFAARRQIGHGWDVMDMLRFAGDFDGDGRTDLIARERATGILWLYPGNGSGRFLARKQIGTGWSSMRSLLGAADWDRDGDVDLLAVDRSGALFVYPGNGKGGFESRRQVGRGWTGYELVS